MNSSLCQIYFRHAHTAMEGARSSSSRSSSRAGPASPPPPPPPHEQQQASSSDPMQDWMRSRQAAFRDFERSFSPFQQQQQHQSSNVFDQNQLFYPPVSLSPYVVNNNNFGLLQSDNFNPSNNSNSSRRRQEGSSMLSSRGTQELSPKAKVSYDEGETKKCSFIQSNLEGLACLSSSRWWCDLQPLCSCFVVCRMEGSWGVKCVR